MSTAGRAWMLPLLELLYDEYSAVAAVRLLRDDVAREAVVPLLADALAERGQAGTGLTAPDGDNLLRGLLALRAKFPREEAAVKVRTNIAMYRGER